MFGRWSFPNHGQMFYSKDSGDIRVETRDVRLYSDFVVDYFGGMVSIDVSSFGMSPTGGLSWVFVSVC